MVVVAVGQFAATESTSDNLAAVEDLAERAARGGAAALVLPEYSSFSGANLRRAVEHAERVDGRFATAVADLAKKHRLGLVIGIVEQILESPKAHNTLLLLGPDGDLVSTYRKVHLYDALGFTESEWIEPGDPGSAALMELDGVRIGAQTCYDLRFPESSRVLVDAGADIVAVPAQWVPGPMKEEQWSTLLRARAIENSVYVAGAGQSAPSGSGGSVIIDPMGVVVAALGERVGVASAPIDAERIEQVRAANPVLSARRYRVVADAPARPSPIS